MTIEEFAESLAEPAPAPTLSRPLAALWHVKNNHWEQAHELAQAGNDAIHAWVHAHLHRVEGDEGNAAYWYRRANRPFPTTALDDEWRAMVIDLLAGQSD